MDKKENMSKIYHNDPSIYKISNMCDGGMDLSYNINDVKVVFVDNSPSFTAASQ